LLTFLSSKIGHKNNPQSSHNLLDFIECYSTSLNVAVIQKNKNIATKRQKYSKKTKIVTAAGLDISQKQWQVQDLNH